jgi:hypothetical protein
MARAPAVCDNCGTVFPSGYEFGPGVSGIYMEGNKSGPCPNCGEMGSVPDGLYDFTGETLRIISDWTPERRQRLATALQAVREQPNARVAAEAVIASEPELLAVAKRLLIPHTAGEFWALVAALVAILTLTQTGSGTTSAPAPSADPSPRGLVVPPSRARPPPPPRKEQRKKKRR